MRSAAGIAPIWPRRARIAGTSLAMRSHMHTSAEIIHLEPGPAISIRRDIALPDLPAFFASAFAELAICAGEQAAGPPFAIYHAIERGSVDVSACLPVRTRVAVRGRVLPLDLERGQAIQLKHVGGYEDLHATYAALDRWIEEHHRIRSGPMREVYESSPETPPAERITRVIQPVQAA
jgi:effector-binding domain-containing protein